MDEVVPRVHDYVQTSSERQNLRPRNDASYLFDRVCMFLVQEHLIGIVLCCISPTI